MADTYVKIFLVVISQVPPITLNFYFSVNLGKTIDIKVKTFFFLKKESYFIVYKILEVHYMFNTSKNKKLPHSKIE